jgi:RNA polymerase sigma-70 factor, ECF subfamily
MTTSRHSDESPRTNGSTSRSLLDEARHADPEAWERLVKLYAPLVASWCRGWGVAEQDLLDVLQDVFSAVSSHLPRFRKDRPTDTFRGWLLTIARNKVHDHFRRMARQPAATGGTDAFLRLQQILDPEAGAEHVDTELDKGFNLVLMRALESIRQEFHERTWQAFWKVVVDGRAAGDVAVDLAMTTGAVRVSKSRVLLRLRRELGEAVD